MADKDRNSFPEQESLAIEALLDEELTLRDADALQRRIVADDRLTLEFESQRLLRQEFRSWFIDSADLGTRQVDVWSHVSRRIEIEQQRSGWWARFERGFDFLRSPGPSKGAFAALAACLALTLATRFVSQDSDPSREVLDTAPASVDTSAAQVARSTIGAPVVERFVSLSQGSGTPTFKGNAVAPSNDSLIRNVSFGTGNISNEPRTISVGSNSAGSIGLNAAAQNVITSGGANFAPTAGPRHGFGFQFFVSARGRGLMPRGSFAGAQPNQALNQPATGAVVLENRRDFLRSGMRTPGADFEWIRSDRGFKILPAKSEAPPVIWVGKDEDLH